MKVKAPGLVTERLTMWTESLFLQETGPRVRLLELRAWFWGSSALTTICCVAGSVLALCLSQEVPGRQGPTDVSYLSWYPTVPHVPQGLGNYLNMSDLVFTEEIQQIQIRKKKIIPNLITYCQHGFLSLSVLWYNLHLLFIYKTEVILFYNLIL